MSLLASVTANQFRGAIIVLFCGGLDRRAARGLCGVWCSGTDVRGQCLPQATERPDRIADARGILTKTQDPRAYWIALCEICERFGFTRVNLLVNGNFRSEVLGRTNGAAVWSLAIPLADDSFLCPMHGFGGAPSPAVLMPFAEVA